MTRATSLADSALGRLATSKGVLRPEGGGDGGGFRAIFLRNLRWLVTAKSVPSDRRSAYARFIASNAAVAWNRRGQRTAVESELVEDTIAASRGSHRCVSGQPVPGGRHDAVTVSARR